MARNCGHDSKLDTAWRRLTDFIPSLMLKLNVHFLKGWIAQHSPGTRRPVREHWRGAAGEVMVLSILLIHGGAGSWGHWARNIGVLSKDHTVIAPDCRASATPIAMTRCAA